MLMSIACRTVGHCRGWCSQGHELNSTNVTQTTGRTKLETTNEETVRNLNSVTERFAHRRWKNSQEVQTRWHYLSATSVLVKVVTQSTVEALPAPLMKDEI